jgi:hypothetical protein
LFVRSGAFELGNTLAVVSARNADKMPALFPYLTGTSAALKVALRGRYLNARAVDRAWIVGVHAIAWKYASYGFRYRPHID